MADLLPVPFGGYAALNDPHLLHLQEAFTITDCYTDYDSVIGRNGYRSALASYIASTGLCQHFGRFVVSATSERIVVVIGGNIYLITEPSTETASDGSVTTLATGTFGSTDNVCGVAHGTNYYLNNDATTNTSVRINSSYSLEALIALPTAALPSYTPSQLGIIFFGDYAVNHGYWTLSGMSAVHATPTALNGWTTLNGSPGSTATYDLTHGGAISAYNWGNLQWLMVLCSPQTASGGAGTFSIELVDTSGNVYQLNTISDPPNTNGSPFIVYCSLASAGLDPSLPISAIRFTILSGGDFDVSGCMPVTTSPEAGTVNYYVTYYDSVTGNESTLQSVGLPIIYNNLGVVNVGYQAARWNYNAFINAGFQGINPDTLTDSDLFNKGAGLAYPAWTSFAPVYTFTGTIPSGAQWPNADTVRLWRTTPNGISLVETSVYSTNGLQSGAERADGSAWTGPSGYPVNALTGTASDAFPGTTYWQSSGTTWSITDNTGANPNANQTYQAGGPMPPATQMTAMAGRIAIIYQNQVSISNFTPVGVDTNPIPQWPPIAIETANGWSYDVSPAPTELGYAIDGTGDALYIGTSEMIRSMSDLSPNSPPFVIMRHGVVGRQAYGFFEQAFFWASYDGVYMAINQSQVNELTEPIRQYYVNTFQPDSTVVVRYQSRKLYVIKGQTMLRFDFVKKRWSGPHTLADSIFSGISYTSTEQIEQMWLLTTSTSVNPRYLGRWQSSCSLDMQIGVTTTGYKIPDWVYSSGFDMQSNPGTINGVMLDSSSAVNVELCKVAVPIVPTSARTLFTTAQVGIDECWFPGAPDLRGYKFRFQFTATNATVLRRAAYERLALAGTKGG